MRAPRFISEIIGDADVVDNLCFLPCRVVTDMWLRRLEWYFSNSTIVSLQPCFIADVHTAVDYHDDRGLAPGKGIVDAGEAGSSPLQSRTTRHFIDKTCTGPARQENELPCRKRES